MNIFQSLKLAFKKIRFNKGKSLFVIIPIGLMVAIIVIASSEAISLINVAHNSIFSPIQSQNEVIEIDKSSSTNPRDALSGDSTGYTSTDNTIISTISNVNSVSLISSLPLSNIQTKDLFTDNTITISSLAGLDNVYASLYTTKAFTYQEGNPIPIILNANDFSVAFEDWQGKSEISIDFSQTANTTNNDALTAQSPIKTKALAYNRDDLIGKTFTITFGGLDNISDVSQSTTATGIKFTQKTQDQINTEIATRKAAIEKYWNYDKISTPISYTFVVAGISEGSDKTKAYVPQEFANKLVSDYLKNEITARNTTAIPTADQNATYTGLVYDGVALTTDTTSSLFAGIRNQVNTQITGQIGNINSQIDSQNSQINSANSQNAAAIQKLRDSFRQSNGSGAPGDRPSMPNVNFRSITSTISKLDSSSIKVSYSGMGTSYAIPGLVYNKNRTSGEVAGEYTTLDLTKVVPLPSNTILIKINDLANRASVVTDLNSKGYNFQDFSQYKQYDRLESYLYTALNIGSIVFMVVTALFILINMAKFVSEGRREIGIFRAIGGTKGDIRQLFILQSLGYVIISILVGLGIGYIAILGLSNVMVSYAQQFINAAVGSTVTLSGNVIASNFAGLNIQTISIYAGALLLVTLVVSLIPSSQAAKISPVEAIRN